MVLLVGAIAAMLLAWKWEFPAALISLLALSAFTAVVHMRRYDVLAVRQFRTFCSYSIGSCDTSIPGQFRKPAEAPSGVRLRIAH